VTNPGIAFPSGFAIDATDSGTLYAAGQDYSGQPVLMRTRDGGDSWHPLSPPGPYVSALVAHPVLSGSVYVISGGLHSSADAGDSWEAIGQGLPGEAPHGVAAGDGALYAGTSDGVYRQEGADWQRASHGLRAVYIGDVIAHPESPDVAYAGSGASGVYKTADGGKSWPRLGASPGSFFGGLLAAGPGDALFFSDYALLARSLDGGETWQEIAGPEPSGVSTFGAVATDPRNADVIYTYWYPQGVPGEVGKFLEGLFKTEDGGKSWREIGDGLPYAYRLAVHPADSALLFASSDEGAFRSDDGGETWGTIDIPGGSRFHFSPASTLRVYATACALYRSEDGGHAWEAFPGGEGCVGDLAVHPLQPDTLFGTTENGVASSLDGGETWQRFEPGLDMDFGNNISFNADGSRLWATVAPYGLVQLDFASRLSLFEGWGRLAWTDSSVLGVEAAVQSLDARVSPTEAWTAVAEYDADSMVWRQLFPDAPLGPLNTLVELRQQEIYWLHLSSDASFSALD
jgi:photosystem II stability/assembly factor-like uncharacterized protein